MACNMVIEVALTFIKILLRTIGLLSTHPSNLKSLG
jgi:hypothetical protein